MCCYNPDDPDCNCDYECDMCSYYDEDFPEDEDGDEEAGEESDCAP